MLIAKETFKITSQPRSTELIGWIVLHEKESLDF